MITGRFANGLRFAVLPRAGHEPGVGLLMRDQGGFIAEQRPGERGLAHLIEHIALVSPTHGAPDDLHHFVRLGLPLTFPAPSAGTTSWRETNYFVSTRTTQPADLDKLLGLMREVATDLTFRSDAVDDQRADVMREMARRYPGNRAYAAFVAAVAPGSPTDVIDAQNSDDVPTASIDTIRRLYHRLYRPENVMLVVVGNVDPKATARLIRRHFTNWHADGPGQPVVPPPAVQSERVAPISFTATPLDHSTALIAVAAPMPVPAHGRRAQADAALMQLLVSRAINNRLALRFPTAPAGKVGMTIEDDQGYRLLILWSDFANGAWQPAVAGLRATTCALTNSGFATTEWSQAKRELIDDLRRRTAAMPAADNVELAKDLSHALAADRDLLSPAALLTRAEAWLPRVDAKAGFAWWRNQLRAGSEHLRVEAPELARVADPVATIDTVAVNAARDGGCKSTP